MLIDFQSYRRDLAVSADPDPVAPRPACEVVTGLDGILPEDVDEQVRELLNYWRFKRGERTMPASGDIDPTDISGLLHAIALIDDKPASRYRLRIRFAGRELEFGYGHSIAGHYIDRIYDGSDYWEVMAQYRDSLDNGRITFRRHEILDKRNLRWNQDRLILPLSDDGARANALLTMVAYRHALPASC